MRFTIGTQENVAGLRDVSVNKVSFKTLEIELHTCFRCFDTPHLVVA